jgi:hypothetical protein
LLSRYWYAFFASVSLAYRSHGFSPNAAEVRKQVIAPARQFKIILNVPSESINRQTAVYFCMLDGLTVASVNGNIVLICPAHPNVPLEAGQSAMRGGPPQFTQRCSVDGCLNMAYSANEESLRQEIHELGRRITP